MAEAALCGAELRWWGLYKGQHDLLAPSSYAHPAKMAPTLCYRIMEHLKELGLLKPESVVLDPMAGTGMTGLVAGTLGHRSLMLELEPKFVKFIQENKVALGKKLGYPIEMEIIQGDARNLSGLLAERGLVAVSSPPYADNSDRGGGIDWQKAGRPELLKPSADRHNIDGLNPGGYGDTPGQIGKLKDVALEQNPNRFTIEFVQATFKFPSTIGKGRVIPNATIAITTSKLGNILEDNNCVLLLDLQEWNQLWEQFQESIIAGYIKSPNRSVAFLRTLSLIEPSLWQFIFGPFKRLFITHSNRESWSEGSSIPLGVQHKTPLAVNETSEISQISFTNHAFIISLLPDKVKPDKPLVITSPPYQTGTGEGHSLDPLATGQGTVRGRGFTSKGPTYASEYSQDPANIGNLPDKPIVALTSPPYAEATHHTDDPEDLGRLRPGRKSRMGGTAGDSEGNIGQLPDRPVAITSPPYEDNQQEVIKGERKEYQARKLLKAGQHHGTSGGFSAHHIEHPKAEGQIGQECGETYLSAMAQVYAEIALVADVLVVVVKNPTRNGKFRRLDLDTIALLEATGWRINCIHHAMLFEEQEQGHLFDGSRKQVKGRMSFFKRLAYQKGSPVADHEDCIVAVKRLTGAQPALAVKEERR